MTSKHWRDEWGDYAGTERQTYDRRPVNELLEAVQRGKFGEYHTIWYAIAAKATLAEAG